MNEKPLISIIIPTYNHSYFLKKCLESVINQTFLRWEAIIINNFSNDNTIDTVKKFNDGRIRLINFRNHGIIAASRNKGIELALGKYIAFLDSDDWWYKNKLSMAFSYLKDADIVYHDLEIVTPKGKKQWRNLRSRQLKKPIFLDLMTAHRTVLFNSSVVVKKDIINQVGNLCEEKKLAGAEDSDLWLKISRMTDNFKHIPFFLGAYWQGDSNFTEISEKQIERITELHKRHVGYLTFDAQKKSTLSLYYAIGRCYQGMGESKTALNYFKKSVKSSNIRIKLASILCIAVVCFFGITMFFKEK